MGLSLIQCTHLKSFYPSQPSSQVGVIVGPGGARTIGALGILKQLEEYQISVESLVGIGWGAWVAGVYAQNKSVDEVRWSFHKLFQRGILKFNLSKRRRKSVRDLDLNIREAFKASPQVSFTCPILLKNGQRVWRKENFIHSCLSLPPFFDIERESSSLLAIEEAVSVLKKQGIKVIIWIDFLDSEGLFPENFPKDVEWLWKEARLHFSRIKLEEGVYRLSLSLQENHLLDFSQIGSIYEDSLNQAPELLKSLQKEFPRLSL